MKSTHPVGKQATPLEQLYPQLTPEQQQEAAYWLRRYLAVIRRIFERLEREKKERLTASEPADTLPKQDA